MSTPQKTPPWFRLYGEILSDRKILRICHVTKQPKVTVIGIWTQLLAMASESPERGRLFISQNLPITFEEIVYETGLDCETCQALIDAFIANNMLQMEEDVYVISNWDTRQFVSDASNDRVRKYREKRKALDLPIAPRYDSNFILDRDNRQCVYCGSGQNLCVDHVYPIELGGTDHYDNLACACKAHNSGKSGRTPEQAGYRFLNKEAERRYKSYLDTVMVTPKPVTVTQTPPESDTESESEIPNGIGAEAPVRSRKSTKQRQDNPEPDTPLKQLMSVFQQTTRLKMPKKKNDEGFWWSNIREIYHIVDEDVGRGREVIKQAVSKLRSEGLTIGGPQSIVNTCRAVAAGQPLNGTYSEPTEKPVAIDIATGERIL